MSACAGPAEKIEVRAIGGASTQARSVTGQIAYARSQLELGSPGLALEAFRKAAREQPDNPLAIAGIADAYAAMGRGDLARRYYEAALALAPHDPALLQAVTPSVTHAGDQPPPQELARQDGALAPSSALAASEAVGASIHPPAASVTIKLPQLAAATPETAVPAAPHLERLSPGEVALVTTTKPLWQAVVVSRTRLSTTVRWVPIRTAAAQPPIRLLNAARLQGLAARTRQALSSQGWSKLAIGDASRVRATSVVLYPGRHESAARRLAARLGFRAVSMPRGDSIVVLLGRDAARARLGSLGG